MTKKTKILLSICGGIIALGCLSDYTISDTEASPYPREYQFTKSRNEVHQYGEKALHAKHIRMLHKRHEEHIDHIKNRIKHKAKDLDIKRLHIIGNRHCRGVNHTYGYVKYPKYHHNYWSYYKTHHVPMFHKAHQHIGLNQEVLKEHGVTDGINFENTLVNNGLDNQNNMQGSSENQ